MNAPSPAELARLVALINAGRMAELESKARSLIARYPTAGSGWQILALALSRLGKDPLSALQQAAALMPRDAEAQSNLGNAQRNAGLAAAAADSHRRALSIAPQYAQAHNNLGSALQDLGDLNAAATSYRRAGELQPDLAIAHVNLGNLLLSRGNAADAAASYQRALATQPNFVAAWVNLGNAYRDLAQSIAAEEAYRRALALRPGSAEILFNLAVVLRLQSRFADAELSCKQALAIQPERSEFNLFMGKLQLDQGNFADAEALFRAAISADADSAEAWSAIAGLRRMTHADAAWAENAQRLADQHPPPRQEAHLRFALGKYFDDIKDYSQAFASYRLANQLTRRPENHDRAKMGQVVDEIVARHGEAWFTGSRAPANPTERPVFVIGMPRSGTSLAEHILATHPAIVGAGELPFWGNALTSMLAGKRQGIVELHELAAGYLDTIRRAAPGATRVVDKMPTNFLAVGLIHAAMPNARFIHMLRNPLDTCLSIYFQNFEAAYTYAHDLDDIAHAYTQYSRIMEHWRSVLPVGVMLEVPYEHLVDAQEAWTRRLLEFSGVAWDAGCLNFQATHRTVATAGSWQVRQGMQRTSVERWRNYEEFIAPLRHLRSLQRHD